jgi:FdhD protein
LTGRTARRRVLRVSLPVEAGRAEDGPHTTHRADLLAAEEPLGVRLNGQAITLTMRTPGDDIDLAAGFLVGEGVVRSASDIRQIKICTGDRCGHDDHEGMGNIADVILAPSVAVPAGLRRNFLTTSACGVCGKASIRDICQLPVAGLSAADSPADRVLVRPSLLAELPGRLREAQRVFSATGGLHAAGIFGADGQLRCVREDVGRHNAVDKVVGWALRQDRLPLAGCILLVSGRASFELVQKAVMAGLPVLAAVSAPSSLAVELAEEAGLTLVGFLRGNSMNVYTAAERIDGVPDARHTRI